MASASPAQFHVLAWAAPSPTAWWPSLSIVAAQWRRREEEGNCLCMRLQRHSNQPTPRTCMRCERRSRPVDPTPHGLPPCAWLTAGSLLGGGHRMHACRSKVVALPVNGNSSTQPSHTNLSCPRPHSPPCGLFSSYKIMSHHRRESIIY
jgi:hypothetical protein